jgi:hypothetical protein
MSCFHTTTTLFPLIATASELRRYTMAMKTSFKERRLLLGWEKKGLSAPRH